MSIEESYEAYCIDEALFEFGSYIEEELDKITAKNPKTQAKKRQTKLKVLLGEDPDKQFADPAALFK